MRLSIGEMSKLNDVSIQTLRYYDKIGILKPSEVDPHSNYRYYYLEDCYQLARIKILKSLGVPLARIQGMLQGDLTDAKAIIVEAQNMVKRKMEHLNRILTYLEDQEEDINAYILNQDYTKPKIVSYGHRQGYVLPVDEHTSHVNRIKAIVALNRKHGLDTEILFHPSRIVTIEEDGYHIKCLVALHRDNYKGEAGDYHLEAGNYGIINHVGRERPVSESYETLLAFVKEQGYDYKKEAIEMIRISSELSSKPNEFVIQIQLSLV